MLPCLHIVTLKEIKPVNPKGNQPWLFIGRTDAEVEAPILWPPDVKSWLIGKDPYAGKDWGQEEKGATEDEMAGWHHRFHGLGFEQTLGDGDGQGGLECCSPWDHKEGTYPQGGTTSFSVDHKCVCKDRCRNVTAEKQEQLCIMRSLHGFCEWLEELVLLFHRYIHTCWISPIFASLGFTCMWSLDSDHRRRDESRRELLPGPWRGVRRSRNSLIKANNIILTLHLLHVFTVWKK